MTTIHGASRVLLPLDEVDADDVPHQNGDREIPDIVVRRLPLYVRALKDLNVRGIPSVSSESLAEAIGVTAAQIRRDLSYFGRFGKQGKGYDTQFLGEAIAGFLKIDRQWDVALVGFGNLGRAITHYKGMIPSAFSIAVIFDRKAAELQDAAPSIPVLSDDQIESEVCRRGIKIGIVAVPASAAQEVAEGLVAGGVLAILNYAPVVLRVPDTVTVREIDPISAMQSMTFYLPG
ncbi:MAG: redox-sensing transcriptional repressor Rex [Thermomicrobiales bacterium]